MDRHAYLIMGHNNLLVLKKLLTLIDDERNDIYLHIDKRYLNQDFFQLKDLVKKTTITFVPSLKVNWGGYSLFNCELHLLKYAIQTRHIYYHLLSGSDLPIRSQKTIHRFFRINSGKEFLSLYEDVGDTAQNLERWQLYHFFQNFIHKGNNTFWNKLLINMEKYSLSIQKKIGVKRHPLLKITKCANWFSITDDFARYIVNEEKRLKKLFRFTLHADEFALSYLLMNSDFKDKLYKPGYMRYIDWKRGEPYTWHKEDFDEIMSSGKLFARKFEAEVDMGIVNMIYDNIVERNK